MNLNIFRIFCFCISRLKGMNDLYCSFFPEACPNWNHRSLIRNLHKPHFSPYTENKHSVRTYSANISLPVSMNGHNSTKTFMLIYLFHLLILLPFSFTFSLESMLLVPIIISQLWTFSTPLATISSPQLSCLFSQPYLYAPEQY